MKKISIDTMNKRLKERFPNDNIEFVFYEAVSKPCKIKCLKCGRINSHKDADSFF